MMNAIRHAGGRRAGTDPRSGARSDAPAGLGAEPVMHEGPGAGGCFPERSQRLRQRFLQMVGAGKRPGARHVLFQAGWREELELGQTFHRRHGAINMFPPVAARMCSLNCAVSAAASGKNHFELGL